MQIIIRKYSRPGINPILLTEDQISQRLALTEKIIKKGIKSEDIMFTDKCRIMLFPKINPKINVIRLSDKDKKKFIVLKLIKNLK